MKKSTLVLLAAGAAAAYLLWRRANDPARIQARGDEALTQAAALQAAGLPVPAAMKAAVYAAHGPDLTPAEAMAARQMGGKGVDPATGLPSQFGVPKPPPPPVQYHPTGK